jgi:hypothetical protein
MNVQKIKSQMFNLEDPADKAFSLFEVIGLYDEPKKYKEGPQLPSMIEYAGYPGYGKP